MCTESLHSLTALLYPLLPSKCLEAYSARVCSSYYACSVKSICEERCACFKLPLCAALIRLPAASPVIQRWHFHGHHDAAPCAVPSVAFQGIDEAAQAVAALRQVALQAPVHLEHTEALADAAQLGDIDGGLLDVDSLLVQQLPLCTTCKCLSLCLKWRPLARAWNAAALNCMFLAGGAPPRQA